MISLYTIGDTSEGGVAKNEQQKYKIGQVVQKWTNPTNRVLIVTCCSATRYAIYCCWHATCYICMRFRGVHSQ